MPERSLKEEILLIAQGGVRAREEAFARVLASLNDAAIPELLRLIEEGPFPLRNAVLELFHRVGGEKLFLLLKPYLPRATTAQRLFLAQVFRDLKERQAVPVLLQWLADPDPNVRAEVCDALGAIADPRAFPALRRLIFEDSLVQGAALIALARFPHPEVPELLKHGLSNEDLSLYAIIAIGIRRNPDLLPQAVALGNADPSWIPVLLENLGSLMCEVSDDAIKALLSPPEPWIDAALKTTPLARAPGALKVLRAFQVEEALPCLLSEYLGGEEDSQLLETLVTLPGVQEKLPEIRARLSGDEEMQRWTRLWILLTPENRQFLYDSLTHPSENVRLEALLHWEELPQKPLDLLLPLLSDPDSRVRHQVLVILKQSLIEEKNWGPVLKFLCEEALPQDLIPHIVAEAPLPLITQLCQRLRNREKLAPEGEELLFYAEFRADPKRFYDRLRMLAEKGDEEGILKALVLLQRDKDRRSVEILKEILRRVPPPLAYAVSETLVQHPAFTSEDTLELLKLQLPEESLVPLFHALEALPPEQIRQHLEHLPELANPLSERELLRVLVHCDPEWGRERFRKALHSGIWFLEFEGARGLLRLGCEEEVNAALDSLSSQGRELVEAELRRG